jgi:phenylalanyl-tRNA synthetase alpha chain
MDDIQEHIKEFQENLEISKTLEDIETLRVTYLGRKSKIALQLRDLKSLSPEEKRDRGPQLQSVKKHIQEALGKRQESLEKESFDWEGERIDITLPGKHCPIGHLHPTSLVLRDIETIFVSMGFDIADGPEIETEYYNFDTLNFPKNHPARDMQDAYWIEEKDENGNELLPRTHTSSAQVRYMETHTPPFRIIVPGKIFRHEPTDASHEHTFHQFEALVVGSDVSVSHFKYVAEEFFSAFFEKEMSIRLRPSYFPFTEPSFEFDISCMVCGGKGCSVCKRTGWIEVGGAGMVNQNVFVSAGYERGRYTGFAWGFGVERLAMMKYKIDDIRLFHSGDLRFIRQF